MIIGRSAIFISCAWLGVASIEACGPWENGSPSKDAPSSGDAAAADGGKSDGAGDAAKDGSQGVGDAGAIHAPASTWTWVPFDDAFCANGTPTGIGINPSSSGSRLLIYFEGGGACWSAATCYTYKTAVNFDTGYSEANFQTDMADPKTFALPGGFFDRSAADNPFKDYSYVFVPYCTGDVFSGNNVTALGDQVAHFVGYPNVTAFLRRIVPTFPTVDRVIMAGSSAGGYGALLNWYQAQFAFGAVRVDVLDDSGTILPQDILSESLNGSQAAQAAAWNSQSTLPPCPTCITNPADVYAFFAQTAPTHRLGLLSFQKDTTLPGFFGITSAEFTQGLEEDLTRQFAPYANLHAFVDSSSAGGHTLFFNPTEVQNAISVKQFVTEMVTDSNMWTSVTP